MELDRVVALTRVCDGVRQGGSGYRLTGRYVLSAAHCVQGIDLAVVLPEGERSARVVVDGKPAGVDLALVEITDTTIAPVAGTRCERVERTVSGKVESCVTVGYPSFASTQAAPLTTAQVDGFIPTGSGLVYSDIGRRQGLLTLKTEGVPPRELPRGEIELGRTPWSGMSGAAVFAGEVLVGVVAEHHLAEGDGSLSVIPLDTVVRLAGEDPQALLAAFGASSTAALEIVSGGPVGHPFRSRLPDPPPLQVARPTLEAALRASLLMPTAQPVVLWGMGGSGKSAVAARFARGIQD